VNAFPFVTDLAALARREVVVDQQDPGRRMCQRHQHVIGDHLFVDDHHVVGRVGALGDFSRLPHHQQVITFGVQDLELHAEGVGRHLHETGHQLPVLTGSAFGGFAGIEEDDAG
jgi:hypothetical protein